MMQNGRPAENGHGTEFNRQGMTRYVNSLTEASDVSGWQFYSGQWLNAYCHGEGKMWLTNARTFIGQFETYRMKQGELHELQQDGTVTISQVAYDAQNDFKNDIFSSD